MARILVLDDHEAVRRALRRLLESDGHEVADLADGSQALTLLEKSTPDLVITDVYMPEMDGIEFLIRLADRFPAIPVIAMSGGGYAPSDFVLEDAAHLGAAATIAKPLVATQVLAEVHRVLAERSLAT